jgi:hypothetical protein
MRPQVLLIVVLSVLNTVASRGESQTQPTPSVPPPSPSLPPPIGSALTPTPRSLADLEREKLVGTWKVAATTAKNWERSSLTFSPQTLKLRDGQSTVEGNYGVNDGKTLGFDILEQHWDFVYSFLDANTLAMKLSREGRPDIAFILKREEQVKNTVAQP